jgi:hypothetical protein
MRKKNLSKNTFLSHTWTTHNQFLAAKINALGT